MREFKQLVQDVLDNGVLYNNGKGNCLGVIGAQVKYDISETLPVVTSKKTNIPWAVAEMAMFIKGISHLDFLKKYGAEKIWAGQSLSEDFKISGLRSPNDVIEDYSAKANVSIEQARMFMMTRATEYEQERMKLLARMPAGDLPEDADTSTLLTKEQYEAELAKLNDWMEEPFREMEIALREDKVLKTKGDLGPIYGSQWRHWKGVSSDNKVVIIDQLSTLVKRLKRIGKTRQAVLTSWNPSNIVDEDFPYDMKIQQGFMGQPPCHVNYHFLGRENAEGNMVLNTTVWLRSNDLMLGHPFNAIGGTILTHLLANTLGWEVGQLTMQISDAHLYEEHIEGAKEYIARPTHTLPSFKLPKEIDLFNFEVEDILAAIGQYTHEPYMAFDLKTHVEQEQA